MSEKSSNKTGTGVYFIASKDPVKRDSDPGENSKFPQFRATNRRIKLGTETAILGGGNTREKHTTKGADQR